MIDYKAIAALQAIIETQSFESAADKLFITQSAISQRIKSLESYHGEPLLIRALPYRATKLGESLLGHYNRVRILEQSLKTQRANNPMQRIAVAVSRDNLETWFMSVILQLKKISPMTIEIIADDQEYTLEYLRKGIVSACASTAKNAISGCKSEWIGNFDYVLAATPEFKKKYFANKKSIQENLLTAPTIIFDNKDDLHKNYLKNSFGITEPLTNYHVVPSVDGFRELTLAGYAYALIPEIDIQQDLKQKKLINLFPDKICHMPLYWHTWTVDTELYNQFNELVVKTAKNLLK